MRKVCAKCVKYGEEEEEECGECVEDGRALEGEEEGAKKAFLDTRHYHAVITVIPPVAAGPRYLPS